MNKTYSADLENKLKKKLRLYLVGSVAVALSGLFVAVITAIHYGFSVPVTVAMGVLTAALTTGIYAVFQGRILPLYRADKLMHQLQRGEHETVEGIFRGFAEGKSMHSGVMMYKLLVDEGKRVGKEPVFRALSIPAIFGKTQLREGTVFRTETVESIVVASQLPTSPDVNPKAGKYQMSIAVVFVILIVTALLWCGLYGAVHKQTAEKILNVAVCTPAHHEETEDAVAQAMQMDGVDVEFSYTNTIEPETVAMYLATFGAMEADILVLNADQFLGVYENDTHPLKTEKIAAALGFEPEYAVNAAGECTGIVLYTPDDPAYNAKFPRLFDWIAVEKDVALVAAIRYGSDHADSGNADLALVHLLGYLADK